MYFSYVLESEEEDWNVVQIDMSMVVWMKRGDKGENFLFHLHEHTNTHIIMIHDTYYTHHHYLIVIIIIICYFRRRRRRRPSFDVAAALCVRVCIECMITMYMW